MGFSEQVSFFKPYKGNGAAAEFSFRETDRGAAIFLSMAKESGERKFDWKNKLNFKLGLSDIGEMLMVLSGRKNGCGKDKGDGKFGGLYHENAKGNAILGFETSTNGNGFRLNLSVKAENVSNSVGLNLSYEEGEILNMFIRIYAPKMFIVNYESNDGDGVKTPPVEAKTVQPTKKTSTSSKPRTQPVENSDEIPF